MSKRAEDFILNIGQIIAPLPATCRGGEKIIEINVKALQDATALLDDFARKERERAAERVKETKFIPTQDGDWIAIPEWTTNAAVSAILADEED